MFAPAPPSTALTALRMHIAELVSAEVRSTNSQVSYDVLAKLVEHIRTGNSDIVLDVFKEHLKLDVPEAQLRVLDLMDECVMNSNPQLIAQLSTDKWTDRFFKVAKASSSTQVRDRIILLVVTWQRRYGTVGMKRLGQRMLESKTLGAPYVTVVRQIDKSRGNFAPSQLHGGNNGSAASVSSSNLRPSPSSMSPHHGPTPSPSSSLQQQQQQQQSPQHGSQRRAQRAPPRMPHMRTIDDLGDVNPNEALTTEDTVLLQCQSDLDALEYALEHPQLLDDTSMAESCKEDKVVCMRMLESGQHEHISDQLTMIIARLAEALDLYEALTGIDMGEGRKAKERALADDDFAAPDSDDDVQQQQIRRGNVAHAANAEELVLQAQRQTEQLVNNERMETSQLQQQLEELRRKHEHLQNKYKEAKAKNKEAFERLNEYEMKVEQLQSGSASAAAAAATAAAAAAAAKQKQRPAMSAEQAERMRDATQRVRQQLRQVREQYCSQIVKEAQSYAAQLMSTMAAIVQAGQMERQSEQRALQWTQELYKREMKLRKQYYNTIQELKGNIRVYCRVRPMLPKELQGNHVDIMSYPSTDELKFVDAAGRPKLFEFDEVYPPSAPQAKVFEDTSPLIDSVVDGFNVCIFAYGQTGSGKTFTMSGGEGDAKGINTRALERLFDIIDERKETETSTVSVSVLEIYCEQISDLLVSKQTAASRVYEVKQGGQYGTYITNLSEQQVSSAHEIHRIMEVASRNRSEGATNMNEHSSRSHMILYIIVRTTNTQTGIQSYGKLSLVDLAGSERLDKSGAEGQMMKEAVSINKSLSALGDVIAGLAQSSKHIPFRNSTLTFLLQDSMAGQAKVLMFVCVSPASYNVSETTSSLLFASRARGVAFGQIKKNAVIEKK